MRPLRYFHSPALRALSASTWSWSRVGWLLTGPPCGWCGGGRGPPWPGVLAPTARVPCHQPADPAGCGVRALASPPFWAGGPLARLPGGGQGRSIGAVGRGAFGGPAGVGQADLAGRRQGAAGLRGLLGEQAAASGGVEEPLFDLVGVQG